jgi:putative spermidine/putrescine transport system permease protein/spermidine/putrescine transport system permease protein
MKRSLPATLVLGFITVSVFVLLYGPILVSVVSSFFTIQRGAIDWSTFNLGAYAKLTRNSSILEAVANTFLVGYVAVLV